MIVIADNDILLKLAQCDLLDALPEILGQPWRKVFISPTAKYQLLPKDQSKALKKCGNEETLARLSTFLDTTQTLSEAQDTTLLTQMSDIEGIDAGELLLFAGAVEMKSALLLTGDRRALRALLEHKNRLPTVFSALQEQ